MDLTTILLIAVLAVQAVLLVLAALVLLRLKRTLEDNNPMLMLEQTRRETAEAQRALRQELTETVQLTVKSLGDMLSANIGYATRMQEQKLGDTSVGLMQRQDALNENVINLMGQLEERLKTFSVENEQKLEAIRLTVERRLNYLQQENNARLEQMQQVVDEKLQKVLEDQMSRSFRVVSDRLEQVYKGLGEMQNLAAGVGDLKKVLSNVKTRGILGELQLGAILEEILSPEQYETNVATRPGSRNVVEFAVKLPAEDGGHIYLPIDSKFPGDAYADLRDAYDNGSAQAAQEAWSILQGRIRAFAKDIRDKYIEPPYTTEFAILFLPFEGLYAEVVNRGMVETLQRDYHVNIAGPSTMAALLNSLQMGFKTFALQQRSSEVWQILGAVKTEFDKFASVLQATRQKLDQANNELDKLVGVRTRQIQKTLRSITTLAASNSLPAAGAGLLDDEEEPAPVQPPAPQDAGPVREAQNDAAVRDGQAPPAQPEQPPAAADAEPSPTPAPAPSPRRGHSEPAREYQDIPLYIAPMDESASAVFGPAPISNDRAPVTF